MFLIIYHISWLNKYIICRACTYKFVYFLTCLQPQTNSPSTCVGICRPAEWGKKVVHPTSTVPAETAEGSALLPQTSGLCAVYLVPWLLYFYALLVILPFKMPPTGGLKHCPMFLSMEGHSAPSTENAEVLFRYALECSWLSIQGQ
jgi:hypothetical protein